MKEQILNAVQKHRQLVIDALDYIWANPETGYREWKTHRYLAEAFRKLGYELTEAGDIPGFYTVIDTGKPGPEVLVMGELDSLLCAEHPDADPETGAVHCCGHAAQAAALLGIAAALKEPGMLEGLSGRICRWLKRYENARKNAVKHTDTVEYIHGLKGIIYTEIQRQCLE